MRDLVKSVGVVVHALDKRAARHLLSSMYIEEGKPMVRGCVKGKRPAHGRIPLQEPSLLGGERGDQAPHGP